MTEAEDARVIAGLGEALDRATALALQLDELALSVQSAAAEVARALVELIERAEKNSSGAS